MINLKNLHKTIDESDWVSPGIDYLQINLKMVVPFLSEILHRLDTDNSNTHFDNFWEYQVSMIKQYSKRGPILNISISIDNIPYPIFQYAEYSDQQKQILKSSWKFVYYGTYFRLLEIWKLNGLFEDMFFNDYYTNFKEESISRVDYKLDFFYKQEKDIVELENMLDTRSNVEKKNYEMTEDEYTKHIGLLKNITKINNNIPVIYNIQSKFSNWSKSTWWTYGSKSNKSLYFRMYDKLVDSIAKGKMMLYDDYFWYESVHRFEIEFRIKFNKKQMPGGRIQTYKLSELSELQEKIYKYLWLQERNNEKFIYQYNENETTDFSERSRYQVDFWWRWYMIVMSWFNPFISLHRTLIRKNLNGELFKEIVHEYIDFISEESFLDELWTKI